MNLKKQKKDVLLAFLCAAFDVMNAKLIVCELQKRILQNGKEKQQESRAAAGAVDRSRRSCGHE